MSELLREAARERIKAGKNVPTEIQVDFRRAKFTSTKILRT